MKNIQLECLCAEVRKWEQIPGMILPIVMWLLSVYVGITDDDTTEEITQKLDSKMRAIFSLVYYIRYKYIILSGGIQVKTWTDSLRAGMAAHGKDITPVDIDVGARTRAIGLLSCLEGKSLCDIKRLKE